MKKLHMKSRQKFYETYYKGLEGRKIVKTGVNRDGFPFFLLDNGALIEVSRDSEGNGPGFLFGLPMPTKS